MVDKRDLVLNRLPHLPSTSFDRWTAPPQVGLILCDMSFIKSWELDLKKKYIHGAYLDRVNIAPKKISGIWNGNFILNDKPNSERPSIIDNDFIHNLVNSHPRIKTERLVTN